MLKIGGFNIDHPGNMKQITEEEYNELCSHSAMLGRIGSHVEDFVLHEEDTTEMAVLRLVSQYYFMRSDEVHELLLRLQKEQR